jgi:hypothetical protein
MGLLIDPTARFVRTDSGALVVTARGAREVSGTHAFSWLSALMPLLDGALDRDAVLARAAGPRREALAALLDVVTEAGVVLDSRSARTPGAAVAVSGGLAERVLTAARRAGVPAASSPGGGTWSARLVDDGWCGELRSCRDAVWLLLPGGGSPAPGWTAVRARAAAWGDRLRHGKAPADAVAVAAARLVAEHRAFLAGRGRSAPVALRIDGGTLAAAVHRCPRERGRSSSAGPLDLAEFDRRADRLCDDRLGVIGRPSEGGLRQLPLHISAVAAPGRPPSTAVGADLPSARRRAAVTALVGAIAPAVPLGAAVGLSADDAELCGLLSWTAHLAVGETGVPTTPTDPYAAHLLRQLGHLVGRSPQWRDLGEPLGAPTLRAEGITVSGASRHHAERELAERLVARAQHPGAERAASLSPGLVGERVDPRVPARIEHALRTAGWVVRVHELSDDPAVRAAVPHLVAVQVRRG